MTIKVPIRATFTGSDVTGLAEYQSGEFVGVAHGGIGVTTLTSNAILLGNGTDGIQSSAIGISGTTLSSTDSSLITIAEGLTVTGTTTIQGDLNVTGTTTTINSSTIEIASSFTFEGSAADDYETVLGVINPDADRTINLPNASGTIVLQDTTDTLTNKTLTDAVVVTNSVTGEVIPGKQADTNFPNSLIIGHSTTGTLSGNATTQGKNTAVGLNSMVSLTSGHTNTILGAYAGERLTTGVNNLFLGAVAGQVGTTHNSNTYVGTNAGTNATGSDGVCIRLCSSF